jgi:hypothetical protein
MPPDDGVWLDEGQRLSPISPEPRQDHPEGSIPVRQAWPFSISLQDIELMPEREIFQNQLAMRIQRG